MHICTNTTFAILSVIQQVPRMASVSPEYALLNLFLKEYQSKEELALGSVLGCLPQQIQNWHAVYSQHFVSHDSIL